MLEPQSHNYQHQQERFGRPYESAGVVAAAGLLERNLTDSYRNFGAAGGANSNGAGAELERAAAPQAQPLARVASNQEAIESRNAAAEPGQVSAQGAAVLYGAPLADAYEASSAYATAAAYQQQLAASNQAHQQLHAQQLQQHSFNIISPQGASLEHAAESVAGESAAGDPAAAIAADQQAAAAAAAGAAEPASFHGQHQQQHLLEQTGSNGNLSGNPHNLNHPHHNHHHSHHSHHHHHHHSHHQLNHGHNAQQQQQQQQLESVSRTGALDASPSVAMPSGLTLAVAAVANNWYSSKAANLLYSSGAASHQQQHYDQHHQQQQHQAEQVEAQQATHQLITNYHDHQHQAPAFQLHAHQEHHQHHLSQNHGGHLHHAQQLQQQHHAQQQQQQQQQLHSHHHQQPFASWAYNYQNHSSYHQHQAGAHHHYQQQHHQHQHQHQHQQHIQQQQQQQRQDEQATGAEVDEGQLQVTDGYGQEAGGRAAEPGAQAKAVAEPAELGLSSAGARAPNSWSSSSQSSSASSSLLLPAVSSTAAAGVVEAGAAATAGRLSRAKQSSRAPSSTAGQRVGRARVGRASRRTSKTQATGANERRLTATNASAGEVSCSAVATIMLGGCTSSGGAGGGAAGGETGEAGNNQELSAYNRDADFEDTSTFVVVTDPKSGRSVQLSNEQLIGYSARQLNKTVAGFPASTIKELKQRRRRLKNRGYAQNCRHKRLDHKIKLERQNDDLRAKNQEQTRLIVELRQELHAIKCQLHEVQSKQ